ncbi:hypothetical protein KF7HA_00171 [Lactococcus lactis]|nr:hypothetical protein [Lactococcus lactis]
MSEFSKWALYAEDDTGYGVIIDYGMQKAEGEDTADALTKTGAHFVLGRLEWQPVWLYQFRVWML